MADPIYKAPDDDSFVSTQRTPSTHYEIRKSDFTDPRLIDLLRTHHATVTDPSINVAGEQRYALDVSALQASNIHLWTIWSSDSSTPDSRSGTLLGCAALKVLDGSAGEIKSMHTIAAARGQGIGALMVDKIIEEGRKLGLGMMYLETGSSEGFAAVRRFYRGQDFVECGAFGEYKWQKNSVFMCRKIE